MTAEFIRRIPIFLVLAAIAVAGAAGCSNTVDGLGQDMEHAGEKIQETF